MKLGDLAIRTGARLLGDADVEIASVRLVDEAGPADLGFAAHAKELRRARATRAAALLVPEGFAAEHAHELPCPVLAADNAPLALRKALLALHPERAHPGPAQPDPAPSVHDSAVVDEGASLGEGVAIGALAVVGRARLGRGVRIGPLCVVEDDVELGEGCFVGPGAVLLRGASLGARVVVGPGAVIGGFGFVYAPDGAANVPVPHVGSVRLEDDVEIGANACVDRGCLTTTTIGRGAKIDNLVQVGHDVQVGEDAVLVALVGVGGWSRIGARALLAGHAAMKDHVDVGDDVRVGGKSGVTRDIPAGAAVSGVPAIPHATWLRSMAHLKRLDELEARVRRLEDERRRSEKR